MKNLISKGIIILLFLSTLCTSCDGDDTPNYDKKLINNPELTAALQKQGFEFEGNMLVINDKVQNLTMLNLSNSGLTQLAGLEVFPKLEEVNLSDNAFETFDFGQLPTAIKSINLKGNPIVEFTNLVKERKFEKLYLPAVAQFDMGAVLDYYKANKDDAALDMQYEKEGKLVPYTFLRDVPDAHLREVLKGLFPSVFTGEQIDLSKKLSDKDKNASIELGGDFQPTYDKEISSMDGVQFIICNDDYVGEVWLKFMEMTPVSYFKAPKNAKTLHLKNIKPLGVFDFTTSINTYYIGISQIEGLKKLDISNNVYMGNKDIITGESNLRVAKCDDIEEIVMPKAWEKMDEVLVSFQIVNVPKLKELDLSNVTSGGGYYLTWFVGIPESTKINFPKKFHKITTGGVEPRVVKISVDEAFKKRADFKAFTEKFKDVLEVSDFIDYYINFL